jgi:hypothetical protein
MPLPANHLNCTTSTGVSFPAPSGFSVSNIAANGATNGMSGAGAAVGQGGYYDFQRFQVGSVTQFFSGYTPVANVAVGAYVQGTGAPQWVASLISNTYAFFKSSNGATAQQAQFRNLGFSLAAGSFFRGRSCMGRLALTRWRVQEKALVARHCGGMATCHRCRLLPSLIGKPLPNGVFAARPSLRGRPCRVWGFYPRAVATGRKYAVLCTGSKATRHPQMGCCR